MLLDWDSPLPPVCGLRGWGVGWEGVWFQAAIGLALGLLGPAAPQCLRRAPVGLTNSFLPRVRERECTLSPVCLPFDNMLVDSSPQKLDLEPSEEQGLFHRGHLCIPQDLWIILSALDTACEPSAGNKTHSQHLACWRALTETRGMWGECK